MAKKNDSKQKGEGMMNPAFIKAIVDMIKSVSDLCKGVLDASDPEKYAKGVNELNEGVSDTYAEMRRIIIGNGAFSEEEKLKRLSELAEMEAKSKERCEEAIRGNREHVGKVALDIIAGLLTCGIYFAPAVIKRFKEAQAENRPAHIAVEAFDNIGESDILTFE